MQGIPCLAVGIDDTTLTTISRRPNWVTDAPPEAVRCRGGGSTIQNPPGDSLGRFSIEPA